MSRAPLVLLLPALFAACVALPGREDGSDHDAPVDLRDNLLEQGLYDCSERGDTGYRNGNAFAITVVTVDGRPVERATANAYIAMQGAAAADGVGIRIVSGFRTMAEQEYFWGCYTNCNCNNCNLAARPGYSNHQSGHALDLNTSEGGVLTWLNNNGWRFGFSRTVPSEAWHWEWWGNESDFPGPCGGSPECLANPNFGGCNGTVVTRCDENNRVSSGDCGYFGAQCSTLGGAPHCVHPYCTAHGGESATWCDGSVINTCNLGQLDSGDCGFFGAPCSMEGGTAHCVHPVCVSHGGENTSWCDGAVAMTCTGGRLEEGNCGFFGAPCSMEGGSAHCVHPVCVSHGGENATWCDGDVVKTCTGGRLEEGNCGFFGATCSEAGGTAHCVHPYCNAHGGENASWCEGSVVNTCTLGRLDSGDCGAFGGQCGTAGGAAHCVHFLCWSNLDGAENGTYCKDDDTLVRCTNGAPAEVECSSTGGDCVESGGAAACTTAEPVITPGPGDPLMDGGVPGSSSSSSSGGTDGASSTGSSSSSSSSSSGNGGSGDWPAWATSGSSSSSSSSGSTDPGLDDDDDGSNGGAPGCSSTEPVMLGSWMGLAVGLARRRRNARR